MFCRFPDVRDSHCVLVESKVVNVIWSPSKDGYLKPKVQIQPVKLGGAVIQYATLHNAEFVIKNKIGLGLGLFIGKTLLEKNFAVVNCWNSQTRSGAEVTIKWKNKDLFNL